MSVHYLLDGYNIIKQTARLNHGTLEDQRQALLGWIKASRPQGSFRNSVTVVFDGEDREGSPSTSPNMGGHGGLSLSGLKVIFTQGQSADDLIKKIVEQSSQQKRWVVVSDDKDVRLYVRALGANVKSVKEFMKSGSVLTQTQADKYISLTDQAGINRELERIWLKS